MCGCTAQEAQLTISLAGLRQRGTGRKNTQKRHGAGGMDIARAGPGIMNCGYGMGVGWGDIPPYVSNIKEKKRTHTVQ